MKPLEALCQIHCNYRCSISPLCSNSPTCDYRLPSCNGNQRLSLPLSKHPLSKSNPAKADWTSIISQERVEINSKQKFKQCDDGNSKVLIQFGILLRFLRDHRYRSGRVGSFVGRLVLTVPPSKCLATDSTCQLFSNQSETGSSGTHL